jgi:hypothetical protein
LYAGGEKWQGFFARPGEAILLLPSPRNNNIIGFNSGGMLFIKRAAQDFTWAALFSTKNLTGGALSLSKRLRARPAYIASVGKPTPNASLAVVSFARMRIRQAAGKDIVITPVHWATIE